MFGLWTKKRAKLAVVNTGAVPNSSRKPTLEPSVIASNVNVLGNIVSDGVLDIDAQIDGNVTAQLVTVRPNGRIRGDLFATEAIVHGTVDGLIKAHAVSLFSTAVVNGTIMHETLMVEDGATVNGKLKRTEISGAGEEGPGSRAALSTTPVSSTENASGTEMPDPAAGFAPANDGYFDHDNPTEKEMRILENLRLIS